MPKYFNLPIISPETHSDFSNDKVFELLDEKITLDSDLDILGCPKISVSSVFEVNEDNVKNLASDSEIKNSIKIGSGCLLDSSSSPAFHNHPVNFSCIKRYNNSLGRIVIGDNVCLQGVSICAYESVSIGDNVVFGSHVVIMDCSGHTLQRRGASNEVANLLARPVLVEDDVWVGYGVIILPGVIIEAGSVIGAGSVVTRSIPSGAVVAGNPAKIIKNL